MDERIEVDDSFTIKFEEIDVKVEPECPLDDENVSKILERIAHCLQIDKLKAQLREISKEKQDLNTKCESLNNQVKVLKERGEALLIENSALKLEKQVTRKILQNLNSKRKMINHDSRKTTRPKKLLKLKFETSKGASNSVINKLNSKSTFNIIII